MFALPWVPTAANVMHGYRERVLYSFAAGSHGSGPIASLIRDGSGGFYGTTIYGGAPNACGLGCGVVFKLTPTSGGGYVQTVLYAFAGGNDGGRPFGAVAAARDGTLYGTTQTGGGDASCETSGGNGCGTVYALVPRGSGYMERVLHRFVGPDGAYPYATPLLDRDGTLYGTTSAGGTYGCGTVFRLKARAVRSPYAVLYNFACGADGGDPMAGVIEDRHSVLYGTTETGGDASCPLAYYGCGVVYQLTPSGTTYVERVLYTFRGGLTDGALPIAGLAADGGGNLYGTTQSGAGQLLQNCFGGCGIVFELRPKGSGYAETILHTFAYNPDGALPQGGVALGSGGAVFGTTNYGGDGNGTVYELRPTPSGVQETILYAFPGGSLPGGVPYDTPLLVGRTIYATTLDGGMQHAGAVVSLTRR